MRLYSSIDRIAKPGSVKMWKTRHKISVIIPILFCSIAGCLNGGTENAGVENAIQKMQG